MEEQDVMDESEDEADDMSEDDEKVPVVSSKQKRAPVAIVLDSREAKARFSTSSTRESMLPVCFNYTSFIITIHKTLFDIEYQGIPHQWLLAGSW